MAYDNNQNDQPLPAGVEAKRKSSNHLPKYFRTPTNEKFLNATLDQIMQPGVAKKVNGYIGRKDAKAFKASDNYVSDSSDFKEKYQLEPGLIYKDNLDNVQFFKDYKDYINQIDNFGGTVSNHSVLNSQEYYSWNPSIDWDKLVNFREYYWLPYGPQTIEIAGHSNLIETEIEVTASDDEDNLAFSFSNNPLVRNPKLVLYRGETYTFRVNTPNMALSFKTQRTTDPEFNYKQGVSDSGVSDGIITFKVGYDTPDVLYYVDDNNINGGGLITVFDIEANSSIDVEDEVLGNVQYTSSNGISLSNGMKIKFIGRVTPEKYADGEYYVEGVGKGITLIKEDLLQIPSQYSEDKLVPFDGEAFDRLPFGNASAYPGVKDYLTINRASQDGNAWTKYNRWFHKSVIETAAQANNQPVNLNQTSRAIRPIIEFEAGLKLFNFGTKAKQDVDLIDTFTKDAFSTIEGSSGYNIDGVDLIDGMRILFTADNDVRVKNKIFTVKFFDFVDANRGNQQFNQIALIESEDTDPLLNETVLVTKGDVAKGKSYWFDGTTWKAGQLKSNVNQAPLFDLFDADQNTVSDNELYQNNNFAGNKIFSYAIGTGSNDPELGFPIKYKNIENVGDITFTFDLPNQEIEYQNIQGAEFETLKSDTLHARIYTDRDVSTPTNGWTTANEKSSQSVITNFISEDDNSEFVLDMYKGTDWIDQTEFKVFVNGKAVQSYNVRKSGTLVKLFIDGLNNSDTIILKTKNNLPLVENTESYFEIASNLERNPLNQNPLDFTLGEVNDHYQSIATNHPEFVGDVFGKNNARDLYKLGSYGNKFIKHSGPIVLPMYHLTNKNSNIYKALKYSKKEYSRFKRVFLETASNLGYDGPVKTHVDKIFKEINYNKTNSMPFYFTDMVPTNEGKLLEYTVTDADSVFFALSSAFSLDTPTPRAVLVYKNGVQLLHNKDYTFDDNGFCVITATKEVDDIIEIYEYESTDGSFVPATPTKLGMYPLYRPQIYVDNTYGNPVRVIQGHDGSRTVAYNDFRDDLLLELEKRIFNNIKVKYDTNIFDIHDLVPSDYRNTTISQSAIDKVLSKDFAEWLVLANNPDYNSNVTYNKDNPFTFNYGACANRAEQGIKGFWRQIYREAYDTDRPHSHPWEMLGITIKPDWWDQEYGPAPYTNQNRLLWEDLRDGIVRHPTELEVREKYKRPTLMDHIPVDNKGKLQDPLNSNYVIGFVKQNLDNDFVFGDGSPVESAWRNTSEYAFSLIIAYILNKPADVFGKCFDRSRTTRNESNHLVYGNTAQPISSKSVVFPSDTSSETRVQTAGLVNYILDYMTSDILTDYNNYKQQFTGLTLQLTSKLNAFTDKTKFNLILDSRTPLNKGNVFIPQENYRFFFDKSSPVKTLTYSGLIIERRENGYQISGYDKLDPVVRYYAPIVKSTDPVINVGGISEPFVEWTAGSTYVASQNVRYNSVYYRVKEKHIAGASFDEKFYAQMPSLPTQGGRNAIIRRNFSSEISQLPYGTLLKNIQDVVDIMLGYQEYLKDQGFVFDHFNSELDTVEDWDTSLREFLFWTTQNWNEGSLISLSPAATKLKFEKDYFVVDDIFDNFYDYSLLNANGNPIPRENTKISRDGNLFEIQLANTADGIFSVILPLVQKQHVLTIDNVTVFNDVIYDLEPGYRQERIKVVGYTSDDWNGSLNIPGFIYDEIIIKDWESYKDYTVGDIVKYKEFYYIALVNSTGKLDFSSEEWKLLPEKPESDLYTNFDYKATQFADFYDLDTDNFDSEQQRLAQHLIGYQKREYLSNIINDDVSQYKFYQGMIQEKGTKNVLNKLFDVLGSDNEDSIEFYEEWAIRSGQYGASEAFEEVEFTLKEESFRLDPQPVLLTNNIPLNATDLVYRIPEFDTVIKPNNYTHKPFPVEYTENEFSTTAGYVDRSDVDAYVYNYDDLLFANITSLMEKNYVWVANETLGWNVYRLQQTEFKPVSAITTGGNTVVTLNKIPNFKVGDIIGLNNYGRNSKFYKVADIDLNTITFAGTDFTTDADATDAFISVFVSVRLNGYETMYQSINEIDFQPGSKLWIDKDINSKWKVIENKEKFVEGSLVNGRDFAETSQGFGDYIAVDKSNKIMAVGVPSLNKIYIYTRPSINSQWNFDVEILPPTDIADITEFGKVIEFSADAKYFVVGMPKASNVKTRFKGTFADATDYNKNDVVEYQQSLWRANNLVLGGVGNVEFNSFDTFYDISQIDDSTTFNLLTMGNQGFPNTNVNHILVRAPQAMFNGSTDGDSIVLKWNLYSFSNTANKQPFDGALVADGLDNTFISGTHEILHKIDHVVQIANVSNSPNIGDIITSSAASAEVAYYFEFDGRALIYLKDTNGTFDPTGNMFVNDVELIGEYTELGRDVHPSLGGYWMIQTPVYTVPETGLFDTGNGLIYRDYITAIAPRSPNQYINSLDEVNAQLSETTKNEELTNLENLTYQGDPGGVFGTYASDKWVLKVTPNANVYAIGDSFELFVDPTLNLNNINIDLNILNGTQTVVDIWDGYLDYEFDQFDVNSQPFETPVGTIIEDETTGATGEIVYYRKQFNTVRVYIRDLGTGKWSNGEDYGEASVIIRQPVPGDPNNRPCATLLSASVYQPAYNTTISPSYIFQHTADLPLPTVNSISPVEFWIYQTSTVLGIARPASYPASNNNDWSQVFDIPATEFGTSSGLSNEGLVGIYMYRNNVWELNQAITIPERQADNNFGNKVALRKFGDEYRLFASSKNTVDKGRIYFGHTDGTDTFVLGKNPQFRGQFDNTLFYKEGEVVEFNNNLYEAITNVAGGFAFDVTDWQLLDSSLSYNGFIPNTANLTIGGDVFFNPAFTLTQFASNFDVSENGEVLVVVAKEDNNAGTGLNTVLIYRKQNDTYLLDQTISSESDALGYARQVAMSPDGTHFAISEPYTNDADYNLGRIYVYKQTTENQVTAFTLWQTINSPSIDNENEMFGYKIDMDNTSLVATSLQGDTTEYWEMSDGTTYDEDFTKFYYNKLDNIGKIITYELTNNYFVPGQIIKPHDSKDIGFGETIIFNNGILYVGARDITDDSTYIGRIYNYYSLPSSRSWNTIAEPVPQVKLDRIKNIFLYNSETNKLVERLDFVDPIQGKIPGPAQQNISISTPYDPATYTTGNDTVTVDSSNAWGDKQVGKVWWDISKTKWINPYQGDIINQTNKWNTIAEGSQVDVWEWVVSDRQPSEWDQAADTEAGLKRNISGQSKYGNDVYSTRRTFDPVSQSFTTRYYFWVKNKTIIPNIENRTLSINEIAKLIENPHSQGYRYVSLLSEDKFVIHNCDSLLEEANVNLRVSYWTIDNPTNIHTQYQVISEGLATSRPNRDIETKWYDSLIGFDKEGRTVPAPTLSEKEKYGVLNKPRQTMFENRIEALKEVIERINGVLSKKLIVDDFDISRLYEADPAPTINTREFDTIVDLDADLVSIGTAKLVQAQLTPIVEDGKIIRVEITEPGRGYRVPPTYIIEGQGTGAVFNISIDSVGKITNVEILRQGSEYESNTTITVRKFRALVENDTSISSKWSIYEWSGTAWERYKSQAFAVNQYWDFVDWYETGYNQFTPVSYYIDESYQLVTIDDRIGDVVKIANVGTGGWLLLEKVDDQPNVDYTVNYKTVGRESGTIKFSDKLYNAAASAIGYDSNVYDRSFYDQLPNIETRIILETVRDKLFVDELSIEYNKLFFSSIRYAFREQNYIDWAVKTSFVKAKHNVGELRQKVTFQNDNLPNYQDYIAEVKPFRTKIREYVSSYKGIDENQTVITDFDLPATYRATTGTIEPTSIRLIDGQLVTNDNLDSNEAQSWLNNNGLEVVAIQIADGGQNYISPPAVYIESDTGTGATAKAFIGQGKVTHIEVTNSGTGYLTSPTIVFNGGLDDEGGIQAKASAVLGNAKTRTNTVKIKYDRIKKSYDLTDISVTETFVGTNSKTKFDLKWPINTNTNTIKVFLNGIQQYGSVWKAYNKDDTTKSYTRQVGVLEFSTPPANTVSIEIQYSRSTNLLDANDRIYHYYNPTTGQIGKDLSQLMTGIDYGGVEITSFDFAGTSGWDTQGWYSDQWDTYDDTFEDEYINLDGSTIILEVSKPFENGVVYNVYKNNIRIDDANYGVGVITNPNAIMQSITGDGVTNTINLQELNVPNQSGDVFVIRKETSDGSIKPDPTTYDTQLQGGDLAYQTATGIASDSINVDGDGFVTPTTSGGPEELLPGHVTDTLDLQVFDRVGSGSSNIYTFAFEQEVYNNVVTIDKMPYTDDAIFVKINNKALDKTHYEIDRTNNTLVLPTSGHGIRAGRNTVQVTTLTLAGESILDVDTFISDGSTITYLTRVDWQQGITSYVTVDGKRVQPSIEEADSTYGELGQGKVVIKFGDPIREGVVISYGLFASLTTSYSHVAKQTFTGDGSTRIFDLQNAILYEQPKEQNVIVTVDGKVLTARYNEIFDVDELREYQLKLYQKQSASITQDSVQVYLNDELLTNLIHYRFNVANSSVTLFSGIGEEGDVLRVFVDDAEYNIGSANITLDTAPAENAIVEIITFTNHDIQDIDRYHLDVSIKTPIAEGTASYKEYYNMTNGVLKLRKPAIDSQYVWIAVSGQWLKPNVDYVVLDDKQYVKVQHPIVENDVVEIIHFSGQPSTAKFGFRIFKDMLNRVHYKRLTPDTIKLAQDLNYYDVKIHLSDASNLPEPNKQARIPGIIWIDGERIEYFVKEGNTLRALRRGTLGTGIKNVHLAGTSIMDQGVNHTIPYVDQTLTQTVISDGSTATFETEFYVDDVDSVEIFAAGRRLRKNSISLFDTNINQDSPEADITLDAEFTISKVTINDTEVCYVTLNDVPAADTRIQIVKKTLTKWTEPGVSMRNSETNIAEFIRTTTTGLPE